MTKRVKKIKDNLSSTVEDEPDQLELPPRHGVAKITPCPLSDTLVTILSTKYTILIVFHQIIAYHDKTYCWPTRVKILELIFKKKNRLYSLSWLDDCLGWLKVHKYIVSYRNYGRYDDGTVYAKASNRQLTKKTLVALGKSGFKVAVWLWDTKKKRVVATEPPTATRDNIPEEQDIVPPQHGKNPFLDPEFRKRKGLKPLPLWKTYKP